MGNVIKIAVRNLLRYTRRSLLTVSLIGFGVVFVLVFVAMTGSFKEAIVSSITDSYLGHVQVHRRGYVASIESLPLNLNLEPAQLSTIQEELGSVPDVAAVSERIKFNAMFSTFVETTGLRVTSVDPEREFAVCPKLATRVVQGDWSRVSSSAWPAPPRVSLSARRSSWP
jgi:putative ABC transport system permease protein